MPHYNHEYQQPTVGQDGCTYSSLGSTYSGQDASGLVADMTQYLVPKYCPNGPSPNYPPRYDTLSHGQKYQCGGYFTLKSAFPQADCTSCSGKPYAEWQNRMGVNTASNIPPDALAPFSLRGCSSQLVKDCQPAPAPPVEPKEGFMKKFFG